MPRRPGFGRCFLAWTLLAPAHAAAQGPPDAIQPVHIKDVVMVLVRHSPQLALAQADASVARAEEQMAIGREDWVLSAAARYSRQTPPPTPGQPVQLIHQERQTGELSLARPLPTGGQLTLSMQAVNQKDKNQITAMP